MAEMSAEKAAEVLLDMTGWRYFQPDARAMSALRCYLVKCTNCGHSVAIAANVPIDEWRAAHSYCVDCGALMEDSHE